MSERTEEHDFSGRRSVPSEGVTRGDAQIADYVREGPVTKPWIRLYRTSLHNPKIVSLNDRQHRNWHNLLLIADDQGFLPPPRDIACHLRNSVADVEQLLCEQVEVGLVDVTTEGPNRFRMHDWETHQYVSDSSTERVREFRRKNKKKKHETFHETESTVSVTSPDTETESEVDFDSEGKRFESSFGLKRSRAVSARLLMKAEGLGLNVEELQYRATAPNVQKPDALFRILVVREVQSVCPSASEQLVKAALTKDNDAAYGTLLGMLMEVA